MKPEEQEELLRKIDQIKNKSYELEEDQTEGYYKSKYDNEIQHLSYELEDTINQIKRRRVV